MMSSTIPVSSRTRSTNSRPLTARRQASVATERASETLRRRSLSAQTDSAPTARSIAPCESLPDWRQAFAEPDDARESVDDGEAVVGRAGDQQPAIVGAEIDRAIGVAVTLAPPRRSLVRRPALLGRGLLRGRRTGDVLRHGARPFLSFTARKSRLTWACFNHNFMGLGKSRRRLRPLALTASGSAFYLAASLQAAPSSNGKTTDSDSVNRGSNPRGASILGCEHCLSHDRADH